MIGERGQFDITNSGLLLSRHDCWNLLRHDHCGILSCRTTNCSVRVKRMIHSHTEKPHKDKPKPQLTWLKLFYFVCILLRVMAVFVLSLVVYIEDVHIRSSRRSISRVRRTLQSIQGFLHVTRSSLCIPPPVYSIYSIFTTHEIVSLQKAWGAAFLHPRRQNSHADPPLSSAALWCAA